MREIIAAADARIAGVRIGVRKGGCAGMEYTMDYAAAAGPLDETVEENGVTVFIDPKAILFLIGTEIDFVTEKLSQRFTFRNPNQTDACGCGESVTIAPATLDA
jgi:iron-sulfur cluster assembly protein